MIDLGAGSGALYPAPVSLEYPIFSRPPWIDPPEDAEDFEWNADSVVMPAIGSQANIVSFVVPRGRLGRIWRIANASSLGGGIAGWVNGSNSLIWQILVNGAPFKNFATITCALGLVEFGGMRLSAGLPLRANDNISLVVTNNSLIPALQTLPGLLGGYYYPQRRGKK
ncbi:MAG: hypothetical protein WB780_20325 [Candidatus Acidiferrales bacterium]